MKKKLEKQPETNRNPEVYAGTDSEGDYYCL